VDGGSFVVGRYYDGEHHWGKCIVGLNW
jgi:hypothetical protein